MYEIRFKGKSKKHFKNLLGKLSHNVKAKIKNTLENHPYPSPSQGSTLCKVEQKRGFYCIGVTGGDRLLYDIIEIEENKKAVLIHYAGNDDGEIAYLKKYAK